MLKIKNTILFAAIVCGSLICLGAAKASAQQNFIPPGSYQKSCKNIKTDGAKLVANCNKKGDGAVMTVLKKVGSGGEDLSATYWLVDFFECDGDIWNDDGQFKCNRNQNSALMQKAKAAMDAAYKEVYGGNLELIGYEGGYKPSLRKMFGAGYAQSFFNGTLGAPVLIKETARRFFIDDLNVGNGNGKMAVLDAAFKYVYSTGVSPKELAFYNAQKITFVDVVAAERKKLVADKVIHRLAIAAAYQKTMGRTATAAEFDYWTARPQIYREIVDASRNYLYATAGAKDLTETVRRALADKGIYKPTVEQINAAIIKYTQKKAIYDEMN